MKTMIAAPAAPSEDSGRRNPVIPKADIDRLFELMPGDEVRRSLSLIDALNVFRLSGDKKRCAGEIAARLERLGMTGISLKSLYRKCSQVFSEEVRNGRRCVTINVWGAVDQRIANRVSGRGIAFNDAFIADWHARVLACKRKVKPAWSELIRDFARGDGIPGFGTWQDVYFNTHGYRPAAGEPCPWSERNPPPGWSLRNLMSLKPDKFALKAARVGMGAAKIDFLPTVRLTRVGLLPCQVVEVDDMWYEHLVVFGDNAKPQRVVEFAAMDRLTGHVICHLGKPVVEGADGTRKTLKSAWVRYLYHYLLCVVGVPAGGCVIKGEHGTAAQDDTFAAALAAINTVRKADGRKPVVFRAGSIVTEPIAKGLPDVQHHGNPRHKGMIEQMHATLKNYMDAIVYGNIGGGRGVQPEDTAGMVREDTALMQLAQAMPATPGSQLRFNFPTWREFALAADEAYTRMDERTDHALEGWEECGFTVGELKVAGLPHWAAMPRMAALPTERQAQVRALVAAGGAEYRERRMSPAEAWAAACKAATLETVSPGFAPMILGRDLAHAGTVGDKLTVAIRDAETGERYMVAAIIDGKPLARGQKVLVWVNPMDAGRAYVADAQGRFMGVAETLQAVRADATADVPELQRQLGMRSAALADEKERLAPIVRKRLAERNSAARGNLAALGLEDPVAAEEAKKRAAAEIAAGDAADVTLDCGAGDGAGADVDVAGADVDAPGQMDFEDGVPDVDFDV